MSFKTDALTLVLAVLIVANIAGIGAYAASVRLKARRAQRNINAITAAIVEYFRKTGVQVSAACASVRGDGRYTALIESEPMKRFRLSHIIEMTLREHIRKSCGLELEKIYWRFPIRESAQNAAGAPAADGKAQPDENADEYINEGLEHYKYIPKVEATELPWEHFEQVSTIGQEPKSGARDA